MFLGIPNQLGTLKDYMTGISFHTIIASSKSHWDVPCSNAKRSLSLILFLEVSCSHLPLHLNYSSCFSVLYAVGIVELELESTSALVLLLFVIPLAFTLSGFLLWIMYSLNGMLLLSYLLASCVMIPFHS